MTEFNNFQSIKDAYLASLKDAKNQLDADVREFKQLQERRNSLEEDFLGGNIECENPEAEFEDSSEIIGSFVHYMRSVQEQINDILDRIVSNPAHLHWML